MTFETQIMDKRYFLKIMSSSNTVFTFKDVMLLWQETNPTNAKSRINYYVKKGLLYSLRRGIYVKNENYNPYELAVRILTPSYISLETVLAREGIIFQDYSKIFLVSYKATRATVGENSFIFKKIKDHVLINPVGINVTDHYSIASKERALLDTIYLNKKYHFDNLSSINWDKCTELAKIYENKDFEKRLNGYYRWQKNA